MKVGDVVANRDGREGVVKRINDLGQIQVQHSDKMTCTYDHKWMLKVVKAL